MGLKQLVGIMSKIGNGGYKIYSKVVGVQIFVFLIEYGYYFCFRSFVFGI